MSVTLASKVGRRPILSVVQSTLVVMRILHTSDWHVGRTFHGNATLEHLEVVLRALAEVVAKHRVDVVVVAGDIFDTAAPNSAAMELLGRMLQQIITMGAQIVLTSGNHDSPARLGYLAGFTSASGLHILTSPEKLDQPISITDPGGGEVLFFGIPFLEPTMIRHLAPDRDLRSQADAMEWAMERIRDAAPAGSRYVVAAHTFAVPGRSSSDEAITAVSQDRESDYTLAAKSAPRDFTRGGVDSVPADVFAGAAYVALGHLHGRSQLANNIRYSGAPLFYSFGETGRRRGSWLVDLDSTGEVDVTWVDLPIPRQVKQLTGELAALLTAPEYLDAENCWVKAVLTDNTRPVDAMRLLQQRFPYCAEIEYRPKEKYHDGAASYSERIKTLSDLEITADFLAHVRNGMGPTPEEQLLISDLMQGGTQ